MKSFIKKFSFVLAAAMVLTSVAVPASAEAATKGAVTVAKKAVSSKTIWAGGKSVNFDYKYGKKTSGVKGVWSSNSASISVNPTTGKTTVTGKADGTVTFTPASKKYKKITVAVKARVRATGLFIRENDKNGEVVTAASVGVGETKKFYVSMSTKTHVKSTYFTHVTTTGTAASVSNGAVGTSYKGANYGRTLTVTGLATGSSVATVAATAYTDGTKTDKYAPTPVSLTVNVGQTKVDEKFAQDAKQTSAYTFTATGLATTAGVVLVQNGDFNITKTYKVEKTTVNADGTYTAEIKLPEQIKENVKYSLRYKNNTEACAFVGEAERPAKMVVSDSLKLVKGVDNLAVGSLTVTNQWGTAYDYNDAKSNAYAPSFTIFGTGFDATTEYASTSNYAQDKNAKGVWYFTVKNVAVNGTTTNIAKGESKMVTIVGASSNSTWKDSQSKVLLVDGETTVSDYELNDYGFVDSTNALVDAKTYGNFNKDNVAGYSYAAYLAFAKDKNVGATAGDFTAYLDGKTKLAAPRITTGEYYAYNGTDAANNETLAIVNLGQKTLSTGKHTITISYVGANGIKTVTSKEFTISNDYTVSKKTVKGDTQTITTSTVDTAVSAANKINTTIATTLPSGSQDVIADVTVDSNAITATAKITTSGVELSNVFGGANNDDTVSVSNSNGKSVVSDSTTNYKYTFTYDASANKFTVTKTVLAENLTAKSETLLAKNSQSGTMTAATDWTVTKTFNILNTDGSKYADVKVVSDKYPGSSAAAFTVYVDGLKATPDANGKVITNKGSLDVTVIASTTTITVAVATHS